MRRHRSLDPLMHLLLGALGIAPAVSCGGTSVEHQGAGGTTGEPQLPTCENSLPLGDTGWSQCDNGVVHREASGMCAPPPANPDFGACVSCDGVPNAWCLSFGPFGGAGCVQGCETDADCGSGSVCFCDAEGGRCITAECETDADCGEGSLCATYVGPSKPSCSFFEHGVACQTTADKCTGNECNCAMVGDHRACVMGLGGCGRPFLIDGAARLAECVERSDWLAADVEPTRMATLSSEERRALAAYFTDIALMEHASIAAFARFSLELVALGAPSELVLDAAHAMADETRHAELAFALASHYAGRTLGPTALSVAGALDRPTLESVLRNVLLEGCIGETVAAAEAQELCNTVADPAVREVFATIARDEARHAALAYRFVSWVLGRDRAASERVVREVLASAREVDAAALPASAAASVAGAQRALELGIAPPAFRAALRREALDTVVAPCLDALLGGTRARAA